MARIEGIIKLKHIHLSKNPIKGGIPDKEKISTDI